MALENIWGFCKIHIIPVRRHLKYNMARFSFNGWKLSEWFKGNSSTIKELVKVGLPLLTTWVATDSIWLTGFGVILGKFILDSVQYWVSK